MITYSLDEQAVRRSQRRRTAGTLDEAEMASSAEAANAHLVASIAFHAPAVENVAGRAGNVVAFVEVVAGVDEVAAEVAV